MAIALGTLGRTPEAHVKWALGFHLLDLNQLTERDRHRAWAMLVEWQRGRPERGPRPASDRVLEAQLALRKCIEGLVHEGGDLVYMPETQWAIVAPPRRRPGARRGGRVTMTTDYASPSGVPVVPEAVVLAFVNDLNAIGADRLCACPLKTAEGACGVIFLAAGRQLYCSPRHAQAAAWQRYEPKRKSKERRS
jgi:hypothetical protein